MSGVLHPVGPEPSETYWVRRAVVIGIALVLVIVLMVALFNLGNGGQSAPAAPTTPSPLAGTTAPSSSASPTPQPSASASPTGTDSPRAHVSATPSSGKSGSGKSGSGKSAESKASASPSSSPRASAAPVACNPDQLKPKVKGDKRSVKPTKPVTFTLTFTNSSADTCTLAVDGDNLELKVYSGTDRIWSTDDCDTAIKPAKATLAAGKALELELTWDGRRSAKSCKHRPETPQPGTYFATAQLKGAKPAQFRVLLQN